MNNLLEDEELLKHLSNLALPIILTFSKG